jgi:hypothetical protein
LRQPRAVVVTPPCLRKKATGGVALRPEGVWAELGWAKEGGRKEGGGPDRLRRREEGLRARERWSG